MVIVQTLHRRSIAALLLGGACATPPVSVTTPGARPSHAAASVTTVAVRDRPLLFGPKPIRLFGFGTAFGDAPASGQYPGAIGGFGSTLVPRAPSEPAPGSSVDLVEIACINDETVHPARIDCRDGTEAPAMTAGDVPRWSDGGPASWTKRFRACFRVSPRASSADQMARARAMATAGAVSDTPPPATDGFILVRIFHRQLEPEMQPHGCEDRSPRPCDPDGPIPTGRMLPVLRASWEVHRGKVSLARKEPFREGSFQAWFVVPYHSQVPPAPPEEARFAWLAYEWEFPKPGLKTWWPSVAQWLGRFELREGEPDVTLAIEFDRAVAAMALGDANAARSTTANVEKAIADGALGDRNEQVRQSVGQAMPALRAFAAGSWVLHDPCRQYLRTQ
jgi:hypothetical protein